MLVRLELGNFAAAPIVGSAAKPTRSSVEMATRKRSRSPVRTDASKWAMDRYRCSKLALGVNGKRLASRQLIRLEDLTHWHSESRQKTPSSLLSSIIRSVEGRCHDDLTRSAAHCAASSSAAQPAAHADQRHYTMEVHANCLLYKLSQGWDWHKLDDVCESFCDELDDLHGYCIQRVVWQHVLQSLFDTDLQLSTGERNAAVGCIESNLDRIQKCIDWCKKSLIDLK